MNKGNKKYATESAVDLLEKLLTFDHAERITAAEALNHKYFEAVRKARELENKAKEI